MYCLSFGQHPPIGSLPRASQMLVLIWMLWGLGCSQEQREKLQEQVSQATEQVQETVKQKVDESGIAEKMKAPFVRGEFNLSVDSPIATKGANCRILDVGNRGNAVQLRSYSDPSNEGYPAVFLQGPCSASTMEELAGQTVPCVLFVQVSENAPIWSTPLGQTVNVVFGSIEGSELKGTIEGSVSDPSGQTQNCQGTFRVGVTPTVTKSAARLDAAGGLVR